MNKNFTAEDIFKKHETNVKSAVTVLIFSGVLGIIYILRYFIKGNFDFYFSFAVPELALKLSESGEISKVLSLIIIGLFIGLHLIFTLMNIKNQKWLKASLLLYAIDFIVLLVSLTVIYPGPIAPESYIDVIFHLFIALFLCVGIYSEKKLRKIK